MSATDTDALAERIYRETFEDRYPGHSWESAREYVKEAHRARYTAVLPIVDEEVRKAKAEALREAAGPEWGNNNTLWSGPRVRAKINRRAAEYETGDSDER